MGLGTGELIVILVIVLIIFGASRVPQLGEALGRGIRNFRKSLKGSEDQNDDAGKGGTSS